MTPPKIIKLPDSGRLFVATDMQGNLRDFQAVIAKFDERMQSHGDAYVVFTGDLVHGPSISVEEWPDYLGSYYFDASHQVLAEARALQERVPGRAFFLLGNHEHAHLGGPVVSRFFSDEAFCLEEKLGHETQAWRQWMYTWGLLAIAPSAGIVMSHAAPHALLESAEQIEQIDYARYDGTQLLELLWARTTSTERAQAFLNTVCPGSVACLYGHDVVPEGIVIEREPLLRLSTSFGCLDGDKAYIEWDLSERAESAEDVAVRGLRALYPTAEPVHSTWR